MKKLKKFLTFTFVFCMVFTSSANVFATETVSLPESKAESGDSLELGNVSDSDLGEQSLDQQEGEDEFPNVEEPVELTGNVGDTVTITAGSATKEYDGKPLTCHTYSASGLPDGCEVKSIVMNSSLNEVGSCSNKIDSVCIVNKEGVDITDTLNITYADGKLEITKSTAVIEIASQNGSWAYDGKAHTAGYYVSYKKNGREQFYEMDFGETCTLPTGDTICPVMTTSVTDVTGTDGVVNTISDLGFAKSDCYSSVTVKGQGKLFVSKRHITITANRTNALYDGTEKSAANSFSVSSPGLESATGLPDGQSIVALAINGTATEVGFYEGRLVPSGAKIVNDDNVETTANYEITYVAGDLNVYMGGVEDYVTITPTDVSATYDGKAHTAGIATAVDTFNNPLTIEYSTDGQNWTEDPTTITATNVADSKTVQIRVSSSAYEGYKYSSEKLEIAKADIKYHVKLKFPESGAIVTYDGKPHSVGCWGATDDLGNTIKIEYSADGVNWTEDPASITVTDVNWIDAYEYDKQVRVRASADNYSGYMEGRSVLCVLPKDISASGVVLTTKTVSFEYDGSSHNASGIATASDPLNNQLKIEYSLDGQNWMSDPTSITAKDVTDSTTVQVRVSCVKDSYGNQNYRDYKIDKTAKLEITPADINDYVTLTPTDVSQVYDGKSYTAGVATAVDVNNNPLTVEYSTDGENWTEDPTTITAKDVADSKTVQIRAYVKNGNYSGYVTGEEKLEITPADINDYVTLTPTDVSLTYDGSAHAAGTATAEDSLGNPLTIEYSADGENWTVDPFAIMATNPEDSMTLQVRVSADNYSGYVTGTEKLTILASEKKNEKQDPDTDKDTDKKSGNKGDSGQKTDGKDQKTDAVVDNKTNTDTNNVANTNTVSTKSNAVPTGDSMAVEGFTALAVIAGAAVLLLARRKRRA